METLDETETDIDVLLECLRDQKHDYSGARRSLSALASTLAASEKAKDYFRDVGGLKYVHGMLFMESPGSVLQAVMYCLACAVENYVFGQNMLCTKETFTFLHKAFTERSEKNLVTTAVFLFLALVSNNSAGQNLAKSTSCMADLLSVFRHCAELCSLKPDFGSENCKLLTAVVLALSSCVNNPQNETNQRMCSTILPLCFKLITEDRVPGVNVAILNFAGQTIAGNVFNQDRVKKFGGLDALLRHLQLCVVDAGSDALLLQQAEAVVIVLSACIIDHGENCSYFLEKGGLKLLLRLLAHPTLDSASILKVTNAIGHAMEYTGDDGIELAQEEVGLLVHLLTETQDDEVVHAIKYILHSSRQHAGGLSTDEVRREQTGILSKVKDLSSKLGLPEDAVSVDDWWPGSLHSGDGDARVPVGRQPTPQPPSLMLQPPQPLAPRISLRSTVPTPQQQAPPSQQQLQHESTRLFESPQCTKNQAGSTEEHTTLMAFHYFRQLMSSLSSAVLSADQSVGNRGNEVLQDEGDGAVVSRQTDNHLQSDKGARCTNTGSHSDPANMNQQVYLSSEAGYAQGSTDLLSGSVFVDCSKDKSHVGDLRMFTSDTGTTGVMTSNVGAQRVTPLPPDTQGFVTSNTGTVGAMTSNPSFQELVTSNPGTHRIVTSCSGIPGVVAPNLGTRGVVAPNLGTQGVVASNLGTRGVVAPNLGTQGVVAPNLGTQGVVASNLGTRGVVAPNLGTQGVVAPNLGTQGVVASNLGTQGVVAPNLGTQGVVAPNLGTQGVALLHPGTGAVVTSNPSREGAVQSHAFVQGVSMPHQGSEHTVVTSRTGTSAGPAPFDGSSSVGEQCNDRGDGSTAPCASRYLLGSVHVNSAGLSKMMAGDVHATLSPGQLHTLGEKDAEHFSCDPHRAGTEKVNMCCQAVTCTPDIPDQGVSGCPMKDLRSCQKVTCACTQQVCSSFLLSTSKGQSHDSQHIVSESSKGQSHDSQHIVSESSKGQSHDSQHIVSESMQCECNSFLLSTSKGQSHDSQHIVSESMQCGCNSVHGVVHTQDDLNVKADPRLYCLDKTVMDTEPVVVCGQNITTGTQQRGPSIPKTNTHSFSVHHRQQQAGSGCHGQGHFDVLLGDCTSQNDELDDADYGRLQGRQFHSSHETAVSHQEEEKHVSQQCPFSADPKPQETQTNEQHFGHDMFRVAGIKLVSKPVRRTPAPADSTVFKTPTPRTALTLRKGLRRATPLSVSQAAVLARVHETSEHCKPAQRVNRSLVQKTPLPQQPCPALFRCNTRTDRSGSRPAVVSVCAPVLYDRVEVHANSSTVPPSPVASEFDSMLLKAATRSESTPNLRPAETAELFSSKESSRTASYSQTVVSRHGPDRWPDNFHKTASVSCQGRECTMSRSPHPWMRGSEGREAEGHMDVASNNSDTEEEDDSRNNKPGDADSDDSSVTESPSDTTSYLSEVYSVLGDSPGGQETLRRIKEMKQQLCPGCTPSTGSQLNSRTFNITIETSPNTCPAHRRVRQIERDFILTKVSRARLDKKLPYQKWKERLQQEESWRSSGKGHDCQGQGHGNEEAKVKGSLSLYDFVSSNSDSNAEHAVSPPRQRAVVPLRMGDHKKRRPSGAHRRPRVPYTEGEVWCLLEGVRRLGKHWQQIINTYPFHSSRTAVDIMEKYKRMQGGRKSHRHRGQPLSMCEERRLRRGVAKHGHHWTTILQSERFAPGRTAKELRDRWRRINKT